MKTGAQKCPMAKELQSYIPKYLGVQYLKGDDEDKRKNSSTKVNCSTYNICPSYQFHFPAKQYLLMENIMKGYKMASSLDAKIGRLRKGPWEAPPNEDEAVNIRNK